MRVARLCILSMLPALISNPAPAQNQARDTSQNPSQPPNLSPKQRADTEALRALMKSVPLLPMERIELKVNPPMTLEGYSAAAADKHGNIYVIHRPTDPNADPVIVLDAKGNLLRSWGKGMYTMPHSIRIDPAGNVWTVDARTSMIFSSSHRRGKKLLEISVGDIPDTSLAFLRSHRCDLCQERPHLCFEQLLQRPLPLSTTRKEGEIARVGQDSYAPS